MKYLLLLLTALFAQSSSQTVSVPIVNPSFEQATSFHASSCGNESYQIPGWTAVTLVAGGGAQSFQPNSCGISAPPDGPTVLVLDQAKAFQDLGAPPKDGVYVLKFWVANYFYWYASQYHAALAIGPNLEEWCETSNSAPRGDFTEITLTCPAQRVSTTLNMYLVFSSSGPDGKFWPMLFDKVSLTFTPTD